MVMRIVTMMEIKLETITKYEGVRQRENNQGTAQDQSSYLCEHRLVARTYSQGGKGSVHRTETVSIKSAEGCGRGIGGCAAIVYKSGEMEEGK